MSAIPMATLIRPCVSFMSTKYGLMGGVAPEAMMAAIGLQESLFEARDQLEMQNGVLVPGRPGPATGFWQFELGGGVAGVMRHPASAQIARELIAQEGLAFDREAVWLHFTTANGDELAAAFARLLLLTDPQPLPMPEVENEEIAWQYYIRNWKPGKPHKEFWNKNWRLAREAVNNTPAITTQDVPSAPIARPVVPSTSPVQDDRLAAINTRLERVEGLLRLLGREASKF